MLEIGPEWLDRYVRAILSEASSNGLEEGIIDGNGIDEPIGMRRNGAGALDPVTGYPVLVKTPLTQITPATYGALISALATSPNGLSRAIGEVIFIVNPCYLLYKLTSCYHVPTGRRNLGKSFPIPDENYSISFCSCK